MVKILMLTGSLEWDLPGQMDHPAGGVLTVTFRIANPTAVPRSYQIFMALFDPFTGSVIAGTSGPISLNGTATIAVEAESELVIVAPLKIDYSNVIMQAALYDAVSGEMAVGLQTLLMQPPEPPGPGEQIAPIIGFASGMMALGMVGGMMTGIITNKGR